LLRDVPVSKVKEFEEQFLMELETKLPNVLHAFKTGSLPDDGIAEMTELAKGIMSQFK
jgi:F-type H+-transporting ATPase subunit alpha